MEVTREPHYSLQLSTNPQCEHPEFKNSFQEILPWDSTCEEEEEEEEEVKKIPIPFQTQDPESNFSQENSDPEMILTCSAR